MSLFLSNAKSEDKVFEFFVAFLLFEVPPNTYHAYKFKLTASKRLSI